MHGSVAVVAERLAVEHPETAPTDVGRVVADCADELPDGDLLFIEQACRAQIALLPTGSRPSVKLHRAKDFRGASLESSG